MRRKRTKVGSKDTITTISIRRATYDQLNCFRKGGESWDEFLSRIVKTLKVAE